MTGRPGGQDALTRLTFDALRPVDNTKEDIARMILGYLKKYPNAGDTLEGICRWWLNHEKIDVTVDVVSEILETLIKEGKVKRQIIDEENHIYMVCGKF